MNFFYTIVLFLTLILTFVSSQSVAPSVAPSVVPSVSSPPSVTPSISRVPSRTPTKKPLKPTAQPSYQSVQATSSAEIGLIFGGLGALFLVIAIIQLDKYITNKYYTPVATSEADNA